MDRRGIDLLVLEKDDFTVRRVPTDHAGGKWQLRYSGAQGPGGNLEVDLNFMHRIPLCPLEVMDSRVLGSYQAMNIPVLGLNDLAAGKLIALMDRSAARDVFDAAGLFEHPALDMAQLRLPFVVMGAMSRKLDLRAVRPDSVRMEEGEFDRMVRPLLRSRADPLNLVGMLEKARAGLSGLLPLLPKEALFVEALWDRGEIYPEWLTSDPDMQRRILATPMLQWKAQHVRKHHGLDG